MGKYRNIIVKQNNNNSVFQFQATTLILLIIIHLIQLNSNIIKHCNNQRSTNVLCTVRTKNKTDDKKTDYDNKTKRCTTNKILQTETGLKTSITHVYNQTVKGHREKQSSTETKQLLVKEQSEYEGVRSGVQSLAPAAAKVQLSRHLCCCLPNNCSVTGFLCKLKSHEWKSMYTLRLLEGLFIPSIGCCFMI